MKIMVTSFKRSHASTAAYSAPKPAAGLGALSVAMPAWDLLKEVTIIFITSTIVWPQVK